MSRHSTVTGSDVHTPIRWTFADQTAREDVTDPLTGLSYSSDNLYDFARQSDDNSVYMLVGTTPTWVSIGGEGQAGSGLTADGSVIDLGGTVDQDTALTPDTDNAYDFFVGASAGNRFKTPTLYGVTGGGINFGDQSDYSGYFSGLYFSNEPGVEMGILRSTLSQVTAIQINLLGSGTMTVTDGLSSGGLRNAADYSANFVDRSLVDKAYADGLPIGASDQTLSAERDVYQSGNDLLFYEGANDTTTNLLTIHGDGNHSLFDPYITLHEGFKTGNGTNAQPLVTNFGKGVQVQYNDGTPSVDVFHVASIVNGSETFTHMETSFQSIRHDYVELDQFDWTFDTGASAVGEWSVYADEAKSDLILQLDRANGDLKLPDGFLRIGANNAPAHSVDITGPSGANAEIHAESSDSALYKSILNLESENAWEFQSFHFIASTANQGQLVIRNDTTATDYITLSDVNGNTVINTDLVVEGSILSTPIYLQYSNGMDVTTNINNATFASIPIFNADVSSNFSASDFTVNSTTQVEFNYTGKARISAVVNQTSAGQRASVKSRFFVDTGGGFSATGPLGTASYIRNNNSVDESGTVTTPFYLDVTTGDLIELRTERVGTITSTITFSGDSQSYVLIERIS